MYKKVLTMLLLFTLIAAFSSQSVFAVENVDSIDFSASEDSANDNRMEKNNSRVISNNFFDASDEDSSVESEDNIVSTDFSASILQGNTQSASDCHVIYNKLFYKPYTLFDIGWTWHNEYYFEEDPQRASYIDFIQGGDRTLMYYSGHGSKSDGVPKLNANASVTYGLFSPFTVSSVLNVSSDNWQNDCTWKNKEIKVLILATCHQLDSSIVKYYGRIMRASNIRAIAGYHEPAPIQPTDESIATWFMNYAAQGNSVWFSWQHANWNTVNGYQDWAVLVYNENSNQYYRLPGFPGNTYPTPSSNATVYRYASFINGFLPVPLTAGSTNTLLGSSDNLPYEFLISSRDKTDAFFEQSRETSDPTDRLGNVNVTLDAKDYADQYINELLPEEDFNRTVCMIESVIREEVNPDTGIVEGSDHLVEKTYTYYNTYNGVKVVDNYIKIGVDCDGINTVLNKWYTLNPKVGEANHGSESKTLTRDTALETALRLATSKDRNTTLLCEQYAYYPVDSERYILCYEFILGQTAYYIDIHTGVCLNEG